jgi:signal transduction histidine kinase
VRRPADVPATLDVPARSAAEPDDLLAAVLEAVTRVPGHAVSSVHLIDDDGRTLRLVAGRGLPRELHEVYGTLKVGEGPIGAVAASGTPTSVDDVLSDAACPAAIRRVVEGAGIHGFACVPVLSRGRIVGTLAVGRRPRRRFTERDVALLEATAGQVGLALENARLYAESRRQLEEVRRAEAQLIQTDRLSAVGRLAAAAAHEVRNPLTAILGQAQLMLTQPALPPDVRERVSIIFSETARAAQILHDLLAFSHQHPPSRQPCALAEQVTRVLELARYDLQQARVTVETDLVDTAPVWADASQLQQVLLNIVQNASQAMAGHGGERRLLVRARSTESGGRIEVLDSGPGLPAAVLPRIFDPFFTTKPAGEGTGLGLWIAYSIIEQHGGRLTAENRPEGGAAFIIELRNRRPAGG